VNSISDEQRDNLDIFDDWIDALDIHYSDLGIIIGPEINEVRDAIKISYNIRVLSDDYDGSVQIDGSYTINDADAETVMNKIYPEIIDYFEERFEGAEINSYPISGNQMD
jgi:hypothetical protein